MEEQPGELQEEAGEKEEGVEVDQKPRRRQILQQEQEEEHCCTTKNYDDPGSNDPTTTFGWDIGVFILHTMATQRADPKKCYEKKTQYRTDQIEKGPSIGAGKIAQRRRSAEKIVK